MINLSNYLEFLEAQPPNTQVCLSVPEYRRVFYNYPGSATLRLFGLAEQCHTQNFYLRCFKSDFDAVKGKFGLLIEQIEMATSNGATLKPFILAEQCHTQNFYLRRFKSDFDAVKSKFGLLIQYIEMATSNSATLKPFSCVQGGCASKNSLRQQLCWKTCLQQDQTNLIEYI